MAGTLAAAPAMCWGSLARCRVPTSRELSRATPTTEARPVKLRLVSRALQAVTPRFGAGPSQAVRSAVAARAAGSTPGGIPSLGDAVSIPVFDNGELADLPKGAGVYAVYDLRGDMQYIGISRQVSSSIKGHMQDLPDLVETVKVGEVPSGDKDGLMAAWKAWVQECVSTMGAPPPGNAPGVKDWTQGGTRSVKPEIRLTNGKQTLADLSCTMDELLSDIVKSHRVVAFIKGKRTDPACGFSFKVLSLLNETKADYEVVDVMDELYNPGLRDAIKDFSIWPTIPQLYVDGEFVGGADVIVEMSKTGELQELLVGPS